MSSPGTRPTVTPADSDRADGVILDWWRGMGWASPDRNAAPLLALRGLLLAAFADCRAEAIDSVHLDRPIPRA